jgi:hypothetical protein
MGGAARCRLACCAASAALLPIKGRLVSKYGEHHETRNRKDHDGIRRSAGSTACIRGMWSTFHQVSFHRAPFVLFPRVTRRSIWMLLVGWRGPFLVPSGAG